MNTSPGDIFTDNERPIFCDVCSSEQVGCIEFVIEHPDDIPSGWIVAICFKCIIKELKEYFIITKKGE